MGASVSDEQHSTIMGSQTSDHGPMNAGGARPVAVISSEMFARESPEHLVRYNAESLQIASPTSSGGMDGGVVGCVCDIPPLVCGEGEKIRSGLSTVRVAFVLVMLALELMLKMSASTVNGLFRYLKCLLSHIIRP